MDTKFCISYFLNTGDIYIFVKKMGATSKNCPIFSIVISKDLVTIKN